MATTTAETTMNRQAESADRPRTLDDLARCSSDELAALYRRGSVPADLSRLVGRPKGRMLAVRGTDASPLFGVLAKVASNGFFPWDGKSFGAKDASEGTGINRVKLAALRFDWFPFETRIEPSVVDGAPCIYLDYEQPGNPFFIARIRDEIREVSDGLFLGPAMWKRDRSATHVLWFAVDFNRPSRD